MRDFRGILLSLGFKPVSDIETLRGEMGTYVLAISVEREMRARIGALGEIAFKPGLYLYVGSAFRKGLLYHRIRRHLSREKRLRWHIDYLLAAGAKIVEVWVLIGQRRECETARALIDAGFSYVPRFGCSECRCPSHLIYVGQLR